MQRRDGVRRAIPTAAKVLVAALAAWTGLGCGTTPGADAAEGASPSFAGVTRVLQAAVDRGDLGGIVGLVHHRGRVVHVDAVGWRDPAHTRPMTRDTLFRIASMTKPITTVAALMLWEEGHFDLEDPVDRWLPELASPSVLPDPAADLETAVPANRSIRVIDLLTHRSGIVTPRDPEGPLRAALTRADANNHVGYDRWLAWIGDLPLAHEPGSTFDYGNSIDVLGIFVQRVSGVPFPEFLRTRVFEPLGMDETAFFVPPERRQRFGPLHSLGRVPADWIPSPDAVPGFPSGAGGLYSTADDYLRFARMLLGGGEVDGVRLLRRSTVEAMTRNRLTPAQRAGRPFGGDAPHWSGQGFGLGLAIKDVEGVMTPELGMASVGSFAWPGVFGTWWQADPKEELILIFLVPGGEAKPTRWAFQRAVYEALRP